MQGIHRGGLAVGVVHCSVPSLPLALEWGRRIISTSDGGLPKDHFPALSEFHEVVVSRLTPRRVQFEERMEHAKLRLQEFDLAEVKQYMEDLVAVGQVSDGDMPYPSSNNQVAEISTL